jgi:hypothetical protein
MAVYRSPYTFSLEEGVKSTRFITITRTAAVKITTTR